MVLDWGRSEMMVNRCLEDLEGRMRLKRTWRLVPEVEKKRNKWVEVSSDPGFWEFHQKRVAGGPCRHLVGQSTDRAEPCRREPCRHLETSCRCDQTSCKREPFRHLGGTKQGEGRGCKSRKEVEEARDTTHLSAMAK